LHGKRKKTALFMESIESIECYKPSDRKNFRLFRVSAFLNGVQEVAGSNPVAPIWPEGAKQQQVATNLPASSLCLGLDSGRETGREKKKPTPELALWGRHKVNHPAHPDFSSNAGGLPMRFPEGPWYRASRDAWYVEIDGKQVKLAKGKANKKAALKTFHQLMVLGTSGRPKTNEITTAHVCDLFLESSLKHHAAETFSWYKSFLSSFCSYKNIGAIPACHIKIFDVTRWLDSHPGWIGSRRNAIICVKRAFSWAAHEGLLKDNPLQCLKKPAANRRERIITTEEWEQLFSAVVDPEFKNFLTAMRETGCRPGEVRKVTAAQVHLELGVWILEQHKTRKKTGRSRVVYLTPTMVALSRRLCEQWPTGPIFRGPKHSPYSRNAIRCRFRRLRAKLPQLKGVTSYTMRHTWITNALERNVPMATVAELAGHTDLKMMQSHYSHLSQKRKHLEGAVRQATGCDAVPAAPATRRPMPR
jgi:integrase